MNRILNGRPAYEKVADATGVPWEFIGITHMMECSCNFRTHLHNGDPLTKRTVRVPANRPREGQPPFTWEFSAEDALKLKGLDKWTDWSIPGMLFQFERFNGFGYRTRGIWSPYLWSFSNHYSKGKFVADGKYDRNAVSRQAGAAVLLRRMLERQLTIPTSYSATEQLVALGELVQYNPSRYSAKAEELQRALNKLGQYLKVDGLAGKNTSAAYFNITGKYLKKDPRAAVPA